MLFNSIFGLNMIESLSTILYKIFLCIATYKDANEHDDKNAVLWTVLVALFGLIPLIIYMIFRYQKDKEYILCPHCGKMVSRKYPVCMFCKQPINKNNSHSVVSEEVKKYLIVSGILFIIKLAVESLMVASSVQQGVVFNLF